MSKRDTRPRKVAREDKVIARRDHTGKYATARDIEKRVRDINEQRRLSRLEANDVTQTPSKEGQ